MIDLEPSNVSTVESIENEKLRLNRLAAFVRAKKPGGGE
ncbi:hypothetical protein BH20ACT10_BH20ACT10_18110 [soil metagenome]|jgi:hypothetical protein